MKKQIIKWKRYKAFTTLELLAVIGIIGVLVLVAFPKIGRYFDSFEQREAKYNHQTIVYSIREWSLQNDEHKAVPNNFTIKNSQGRSVADYMKEYNREYYTKYIEREVSAGNTIVEIKENNPERVYTFSDGKLITTVTDRSSKQVTFEFDPLKGVSNRSAWIRG